jgi:hypothetical protein
MRRKEREKDSRDLVSGIQEESLQEVVVRCTSRPWQVPVTCQRVGSPLRRDNCSISVHPCRGDLDLGPFLSQLLVSEAPRAESNRASFKRHAIFCSGGNRRGRWRGCVAGKTYGSLSTLHAVS